MSSTTNSRDQEKRRRELARQPDEALRRLVRLGTILRTGIQANADELGKMSRRLERSKR